MKNKAVRRKIFTLLISIVILLIVALGIVIYIKSLQSATTSSITTLVNEMAEHDMNSIENEVTMRFDELEFIWDRIMYVKPQSVNELCLKLSEENAPNYFDNLFLIDSNGISYSATMLVENSKDKEYTSLILSGYDRFAVRSDETDVMEATTESVVYGLQTAPYTVGDVKIVGIVGSVNIRDLENKLKLQSFNGRGLTFVISGDGSYIINENRSAGIGKRDNLFEDIGKTIEPVELEKIKQRIANKESFIIEFFCDTHQTNEVACFIPMEHHNWTLVMRVTEEVFSEQTRQFVFMSAVMLICVVALIVVLTIIIFKMRMRETSARLDAQSKSEFLSNMSHEIRTPLNGIIGLNELMIRNVDDPDKLNDCLEKSLSTANYLLALINDILDYSKMQSGHIELINEPFSVSQMASSVENIVKAKTDVKNISLEVNTMLIYPNIIGDMMRIEQILMNILGNAVKFTDSEGRIVLNIVQTEEGRGFVKTSYSVIDNGCGISEDFQKKIFDSFSQERGRTSSSIKGTGLGMAISHTLCSLMGGELTVQSKLNVGSTFSFTLVNPIAENFDETSSAQADTVLANQSKADFKILIAEDNELNAEILMELLADEGLSADHAQDGGRVVEMFEKSEIGYYNLILMDVQMPVQNGYEATKAIRNLNRADASEVQIFACTANAFKEDSVKAIESGMNDFIAKPIDIHKLMTKISNITNGG